MRVNLISDTNGRGLDLDQQIIQSAIAELTPQSLIFRNGKYPANSTDQYHHWIDRLIWLARIKFSRISSRIRVASYEANIFIEKVPLLFIGFSNSNVLIPNLEWFNFVDQKAIPQITHVLAKSRSSMPHLMELFPSAAVSYIGFTSPDAHIPDTVWSTPLQCLHVGGHDEKGTSELLDLWLKHPEWPHLTVISQQASHQTIHQANNISLIDYYIDISELRIIQNSCLIHICPSRVEGFGHTINEGMSCGAVVMTTNAPPMNELIPTDLEMLPVMFEVTGSTWKEQEKRYDLNIDSMEQAIQAMIALPVEELNRIGKVFQASYLQRDEAFKKRLAHFLTPLLQ